MLKELRGPQGGPHVGTRLVALVVALLLAAPLTYAGGRAVVWLVRTAL